MRDELAEALGIDLDDPSQQRAQLLVEADSALLENLRMLRKTRGITVEQVAKAVGWEVARVHTLESYAADPRLSELRRYAHAVGALVSHEVSLDPAAGPVLG